MRPKERETTSALGQLRKVFTGTQGLLGQAWKVVKDVSNSLVVIEEKIERGSSGAVSRSAEPVLEGGGGQVSLGQMEGHAEVMPKSSGIIPWISIGLLIRREMLSCVLIVHSLKIKRY